MPAGKINPFFYKTGNGSLSIYRGSCLLGHGWAWLGMPGGCLGGAQAPPAIPQQANLPHFHQFELFSSNLFDKFRSFDEFGGDLVGKRCCS
jgi:hypothetical protein